ncbi:undecaprenyl pyrophosphate phosphatase [uncultured Roseburia sp.]|uniref:Phosphatase PAP2 family protein n=1 Tax=Brotonthovivens ammoniilytica TaxID=2981725 RepID=A0ABT2TLY3_9FIRM|nr:phosphatase PAP2 family protein [Brotonthovivens ammoniilytica]MCU6762821.1 phosphatase PAP2 family protein [Brotonthovivens ammoniilytica]SCI90170.1 undecaprenyl pyrophosphate phosphatase [uncultured Roseburia sp.]
MTKELYEKISEPFKKTPRALRVIEKGNKILTAVTYIAYIGLLLWEVSRRDENFWRVFLIPAIAFAAVTCFRKVYNAKRPYEVLDIHPLLKRRKKGQSFPSRHAFSIFMIAMAVGTVWSLAGILFLALGVLLAAVRVIGGVHFPRDVIAGAAVGIATGIFGFYVF